MDENNIFFDLDYFIYRIYDNEFLNRPYDGYLKSLEDPQYFTPLAPEMLANMGLPTNAFNPYKADVFSFGMVLLYVLRNFTF